jgi:hypothetical protein
MIMIHFTATAATTSVLALLLGIVPPTFHISVFPHFMVPIPTKPPVYNGMIAPRDSWMMPPPCNEMIPPGAPRMLAERVFHLTWFLVKPF